MKVIGLTGGIASGKSTASSILRKFGATIIDADLLAREVTEKGQPTLEKIIKTFGREILKDDGTLNRKALGKIVFDHREKLLKLNEIIHPAVNQRAKTLFQQEKEKGKKKVVYDCPLLMEENLYSMVDTVWLIYVDETTQLSRLMKRDGFTREEAIKRIKSQMPLDDKLKLANIVIENNGSVEELEKKLRKYWHEK
ncbi:dephospho-CoA kinase [Irregularibacter muris]|uniref:Dephospho-CoA kinase n=1 Tax=Irregularibacter muris TaxID=1796619 RepID=A0AAE3HJI7_9FIRM|nr:dephospho-CoA kinase [Irregularibacter muris]MCR1899873.1 dephospho-CoA kinase [Irregularibacter muris]